MAAQMQTPQPAPTGWQGPLARYKQWVRAHPNIVANLDLLATPLMWNPARTSQASELYYEACHALLGLLNVWHNHIIDSEHAAVQRPAAALWLDAVEQVSTLIELRGLYLEQHGERRAHTETNSQISRYGPLAVFETVKALLKMAMWSQYPGHLFLRHPGPEDLDQFESERGLADVINAMERLRLRYTTQQQPTGLMDQLRCWISAVTQQPTKHTPTQSPSRAKQSAPQTPLFCASDTRRGSMQDQQGWGSAHSRLSDGFAVPTGSPFKVPMSPGRASAAAEACKTLWTGRVMPVSQQMRMGGDLVWVAELLHIWRPVIYVYLLKRYGRTSWRPWAISLAIDMLSMHFTHRGKAILRQAAAGGPRRMAPREQRLQQQQRSEASMVDAGMAARMESGWCGPIQSSTPQPPPGYTSLLSLAMARGLLQQPWSDGELRELRDRRAKLAYYLLRSPALDWFVKPIAEGIRVRTARVPVVSWLTDYAADVLDNMTSYYTYTACSN